MGRSRWGSRGGGDGRRVRGGRRGAPVVARLTAAVLFLDLVLGLLGAWDRARNGTGTPAASVTSGIVLGAYGAGLPVRCPEAVQLAINRVPPPATGSAEFRWAHTDGFTYIFQPQTFQPAPRVLTYRWGFVYATRTSGAGQPQQPQPSGVAYLSGGQVLNQPGPQPARSPVTVQHPIAQWGTTAPMQPAAPAVAPPVTGASLQSPTGPQGTVPAPPQQLPADWERIVDGVVSAQIRYAASSSSSDNLVIRPPMGNWDFRLVRKNINGWECTGWRPRNEVEFRPLPPRSPPVPTAAPPQAASGPPLTGAPAETRKLRPLEPRQSPRQQPLRPLADGPARQSPRDSSGAPSGRAQAENHAKSGSTGVQVPVGASGGAASHECIDGHDSVSAAEPPAPIQRAERLDPEGGPSVVDAARAGDLRSGNHRLAPQVRSEASLSSRAASGAGASGEGVVHPSALPIRRAPSGTHSVVVPPAVVVPSSQADGGPTERPAEPEETLTAHRAKNEAARLALLPADDWDGEEGIAGTPPPQGTDFNQRENGKQSDTGLGGQTSADPENRVQTGRYRDVRDGAAESAVDAIASGISHCGASASGTQVDELATPLPPDEIHDRVGGNPPTRESYHQRDALVPEGELSGMAPAQGSDLGRSEHGNRTLLTSCCGLVRGARSSSCGHF